MKIKVTFMDGEREYDYNPDPQSYTCKASGREFIIERSIQGFYEAKPAWDKKLASTSVNNSTLEQCKASIERIETERLEAEARIKARQPELDRLVNEVLAMDKASE